MSDDIVTRLNTEEMTKAFYKAFPTVVTLEDAMRQALEAADEIERLREWKELAYEMRNRSWWAMRNKVLVKFDDMHKSDWKRHE